VYLFEDKGELAERVAALRARMLQAGDQLLTSALTLGELLVKPLESGEEELSDIYERGLVSASTVIAFDAIAARFYARIRIDRSIRPPDAVQLACAARGGADLFITNDSRLSRKLIPGVPFIAALEHAPI
jgi:predicted nucleic acid-binding protein